MNVTEFDSDTLDGLSRILSAHDVTDRGDLSRMLPGADRIDHGSYRTIKQLIKIALRAAQANSGSGRPVLTFLEAVVRPVRFAGRQPRHATLLRELNQVLAFSGLVVGDDGKVRPVIPARTLPEAQERANRLRARLHDRSVHPDVLLACRSELVEHNYFHAVLEATKSVAEKLRAKTGLTSDGSHLVSEALCGSNPRLAINSLATEPEHSEQSGFANLLKGMFGMFRNTTAHAPKVTWAIDEIDALDLLTLVSLAHRRLDAAVPHSSGS